MNNFTSVISSSRKIKIKKSLKKKEKFSAGGG